MDWSIFISILAIIVSVISAYIARSTLKAQLNISRNTALIEQTSQNEQLIANHPKLLELYNIKKDDLSKYNLNELELIYIWSDLRQGEIFHRIGDNKIILTDYRKNFLNNKKVQIAFKKFIYKKLMSQSIFTDTVNDYINNHSMI